MSTDRVIKNWLKFLDKSSKARVQIIREFNKAIDKLDTTVEEQRQATILLLKKALSLNEGDEVRLFSDGHYEIIKGGASGRA